jgi:hypothetical protein
MKHSLGPTLILMSAIGIGASVHATQPPDVVTSDSNLNTAMGTDALLYLTTGTENTAAGDGASETNLAGSWNTALGVEALFGNTSGDGNTATGAFASSQDNGSYNAAYGYRASGAGSKSGTSSYNTSIGAYALQSNNGNYNTALGYEAGINLTTGSNNIDIGHNGVAGDSAVIRIGTAGTQTTAYIAGIENSTVTGSAVYVTSSGQLGVKASSERYKMAIAPMGAQTEKLLQLRPVSFHLKTEPNGELQYGLIAEEVVKVFPELVIRNEQGRIDGVRYDELAPMLLNELQKQQHAAAHQAAEIRALKRQLAEIQAALSRRQPGDQLVARRQ